MRILNCFNMAQDAYNVTAAMRRRGVDADLLVTDREYQGDVPGWESNDGVEWIRTVKVWKHRGLREAGLLWKLTAVFSEYDLIFCHVPSSMYARLIDCQYVPYDAGLIRYLPFRLHPLPPYRKRWLTRLAYRQLRASYEEAKAILFTNPDTFTIFEETRLPARFVPFAIDSERYKPVARTGAVSWDKQTFLRPSDSLMFFMPSRHHWAEKGNDKAIRAFARFRKQCPGSLLVMVNWGTDIARSRMLANELAFTKRNLIFVEPMPKSALIQMYSEADVVLDQFVLGSWGTATPEAMSCAKPVIMHYDKEAILKCFGSLPPLCRARGEDEILAAMETLGSSRERELLGGQAREWVKHTHSPNVAVDVHMKVAGEVLC